MTQCNQTDYPISLFPNGSANNPVALTLNLEAGHCSGMAISAYIRAYHIMIRKGCQVGMKSRADGTQRSWGSTTKGFVCTDVKCPFHVVFKHRKSGWYAAELELHSDCESQNKMKQKDIERFLEQRVVTGRVNSAHVTNILRDQFQLDGCDDSGGQFRVLRAIRATNKRLFITAQLIDQDSDMSSTKRSSPMEIDRCADCTTKSF